MTPYACLLAAAGLTQAGAAALHGVREDSVRRWVAGRRSAPEYAIEAIAALVAEQARRGGVLSAAITDLAATGAPTWIEVGCGDGAGLPAGAEPALIGHALAALPADLRHRVRIVPRGSTPATRAASQARVGTPAGSG